MSSASAIADALVAVLDGMTDTDATKEGYDILNISPQPYVFVVRPATGDIEPAHFSGDTLGQSMDISIRAEAFVRNEGDERAYMNNQWGLINTVRTTIDDHSTLSDACDLAYLQRWEVREYEFNIEGQVWQPIWCWIRCIVL